jgi:hypothetical protein
MVSLTAARSQAGVANSRPAMTQGGMEKVRRVMVFTPGRAG